jgi:uncharacterized protein YecE (DUF72 family)
LERRIGTAGWTLPREVRDRFPPGASQLERYAGRFSGVEINSSFYRPHRASTYARWAASVPDDFRFALKVPKEITHERRFVDVGTALGRFLDESAGLGVKRDVLLVQTPPSLSFDRAVAEAFLALMRSHYAGRLAWEPRHQTWFEPEASALLVEFHVARVAADPPRAGTAFAPGGCEDFHYWRLHGSPRTYYSAYDDVQLDALIRTLRSASVPSWCIFDNTAAGAATADALKVSDAL